jgi:hypothetical protein
MALCVCVCVCVCVRERERERERERRLGALERLELPSKLVKRCHNQADIGPRKAGKALETLERKKDHAKLTKRCHSQASKGPVQQELEELGARSSSKLNFECVFLPLVSVSYM